MEQLKGKKILIGKDPSNDRLLVAVSGLGKNAAAPLAGTSAVPASVSRCLPGAGVAHACISVDEKGVLTLENLKSQNVTFVNGKEIVSKRVTVNTDVQLGRDRYSVQIATIIEAAGRLVGANVIRQGQAAGSNQAGNSGTVPPPAPKQKFNIRHLEMVYDNMKAEQRRIKEGQRRLTLIRSAAGIFTSCALLASFVFGQFAYILTGIGVLGNIYTLFVMKNNDTTEEMERINEEFQDRYVCPNPDCQKFLGNMRYKLLRKQYSMQCPHCKCGFVD